MRSHSIRAARTRSQLATAIAVVPVVSGIAAEPEPGPPVSLAPIIVTATRVGQPADDLPFTIHGIEAVDLVRMQPRTAPDLFRETPGVMIQRTGHAQGSPYVRGFTGFRNLMLIDGIRLNNSVFRDGPNQYWATIDPLSVDRVELLKGPASVLYGSDAIGGAAQVFTQSPTEGAAGYEWTGRAYYRAASGEHSLSGRVEAGGPLTEATGFLAGVSYKDYGDLAGGADVGRQLATGYTDLAADAKIEHRISQTSRLSFAHQSVAQNDAWRTHRTTSGLRWQGLSRGTDRQLSYDQTRQLTYAQFHAEELDGFIQEIHASLSHQLQSEVENRIRSDQRRGEQGFDVNTLGISGWFHSPSRVGNWVYGWEYYHDWVNSFATSTTADGNITTSALQGPVGDDSAYDLVGGFIENQIALGQRWHLLLGGRLNYARAEVGQALDPLTGQPIAYTDSWTALVGSGRFLYDLDTRQRWGLFAGASQGFRAPNLSDLSRLDIAASGELEVPSLSLDPEYFHTFEVGTKFHGPRLSGQIAYFWTIIDGMVVRTPTGDVVNGAPIVAKENSGDGHVQGIEAELRLKVWKELEFRSMFTWTEGELETYTTATAASTLRTEPLSRVMPTTWQAAIAWGHPVLSQWWIDLSCVIAASQDRLADSDIRDNQRIPPGGTPGYDTYTLRSGWNPSSNLSVVAAVENITDQDYRVHGSGVNEVGRNFLLSIQLRF